MARTALNGLKNDDFSDRELLHVVNDLADNDGYTTSQEIAHQLGIRLETNGHHVTQEDHLNHGIRCVGTRFAWMVRFGFCERDEDRTKWRLTAEGHDLMNGRLTSGLQKALDKLDPADRVLLMREIATGYVDSSPAAAAMLRREWQRGYRRRGR